MASQDVIDDIYAYFHFWPSRDLAIVALSLYLLASLGVLAMTIKTRCWYMLIPSIVGLLEAGGYVCRILMFSSPMYGTYVAMMTLLIIPPSFLALTQYITLGKVVNLVKRTRPDVRLPLRGGLIMTLYFVIEFGSLALQGAGAGLSVTSDDTAPSNESTGKALLMVGLALLVALIVSYLVNAVYVHATPAFGVRQSRSLTRLFAALYVSTTLLLVRNIFRLIEFAGGWYGSLATQEAYFYVLDSLMILLVLVVFTFFHFGLFFNGYRREQEREQAAREGKAVAMGWNQAAVPAADMA